MPIIEQLDQTGPSAGLIEERSQAFSSANNYLLPMNLEVATNNQDLIDYFSTLAASLVKNIYSENEKKAARTIKEKVFSSEDEKVGSNAARRDFMYNSAIKAFCAAYGVTADQGARLADIVKAEQEPDILKLKLALEALRSAAYFGSGQACQQLIEASERELFVLSNEEIRAVIRAQILWYREGLGNRELQNAQTLPALLGLPKAWAAMREDHDLYAEVLRVAYLDSGVTTQEVITANENAPYITLHPQEVLDLIENQIARYKEQINQLTSVVAALQHAPMRLLEQPKVIEALRAYPQRAYTMLLDFQQFLATNLPHADEIATREQLNQYLDRHPMLFKGYFEDRETHQAIATAEIAAEEQSLIKMRNIVSQAISHVNRGKPTQLKLNHLVVKEKLDALYAMRPAIAAKTQSNAAAQDAADVARKNQQQKITTDKQKKAKAAQEQINQIEAEEQADQTTTLISFPRRYKGMTSGLERLAANVGAVGKEDKKSIFELNKDIEKAQAENRESDIAIYQQRLSGAGYDAYVERKRLRDDAIQQLKDSLVQEYSELDRQYQEFCQSQENEARMRAAEFQGLITEEEVLRCDFAVTNPFSKTIEFIFEKIAQDFAVYRTLTADSKRDIALLLVDDLRAIMVGTFAYKEIDRKGRETLREQQLPFVVAANSPAYLTMLSLAAEVFLVKKGSTFAVSDVDAGVEAFWTQLQDRLLDESGHVRCMSDDEIVELLSKQSRLWIHKDKRTQDITLADKENMQNLLVRYRDPSYQDSLSALIDGSMALALFVSVNGELFPAHNAEYAVIMQETAAARARLSKIVARSYQGVPSRLRNYIQMALVAMLDKTAIGRLLLEDQHNPVYGILVDLEVIQAGDYECGMDSFRVGKRQTVVTSISQLSDNQERNITLGDINNAYYLLAYLKAKLADKNSVVDVLVFEKLCYVIHAKFLEYCAHNGQSKVAEDINPVLHTNEASERRRARAGQADEVARKETLRRSSLTSATEGRRASNASRASFMSPVPGEKAATSTVSDDVSSGDETHEFEEKLKPFSIAVPLPMALSTVIPREEQDEINIAITLSIMEDLRKPEFTSDVASALQAASAPMFRRSRADSSLEGEASRETASAEVNPQENVAVDAPAPSSPVPPPPPPKPTNMPGSNASAVVPMNPPPPPPRRPSAVPPPPPPKSANDAVNQLGAALQVAGDGADPDQVASQTVATWRQSMSTKEFKKLQRDVKIASVRIDTPLATNEGNPLLAAIRRGSTLKSVTEGDHEAQKPVSAVQDTSLLGLLATKMSEMRFKSNMDEQSGSSGSDTNDYDSDEAFGNKDTLAKLREGRAAHEARKQARQQAQAGQGAASLSSFGPGSSALHAASSASPAATKSRTPSPTPDDK